MSMGIFHCILIYLAILATWNNAIEFQPDYIISKEYDIALYDLLKINNSIRGDYNVDIQIINPNMSIIIHSESYIIIRYVELTPVDEHKRYHITAKDIEYHFHNQTASITNWDYELSPENYTLRIHFNTLLSIPPLEPSHINDERGGIWFVGTDFKIMTARRIFPFCIESSEAIFSFSISHPVEYIILSNIIKRSYKKTGDLKLTTLKVTIPIPANSTVIVIHDFPLSLETMNIKCRDQIASQLRYAGMFIKNFTLYFTSEWPRCKKRIGVKHVAIPNLFQENKNIFGFILYREEALIYNEESDSITRRLDTMQLIGRAIARNCFDIPFRVLSKWSHLWFYEGMNMLLAADAIDEIHPDLRIWDLFAVQIRQESLRLDTFEIMNHFLPEQGDTKLNSIPPLNYYKAPALLRMLQNVVGDDIFKLSFETFLNLQSYKTSFNPDDLWTAIQKNLEITNVGKIGLIKFNIKNMMNSWIPFKHYPILNIIPVDLYNVTIFVDTEWDESMRIYKYDWDTAYIMPITYTEQLNSLFYILDDLLLHTRSFIGKSTIEIGAILPLNHWIIFNIQQAGYYRVRYNPVLWNNIIGYLNSNAYTNIHVLNRAQIIDDAFFFLITSESLSLSTFLNLTQYLQRETDYIAWYPMFKALERLSGFFLLEQSKSLKIHMQNIFHRLLKKINYIEQADEKPLIKCLRQEAAKWACFFNDSECQNAALRILDQHLRNITRLSPEWKRWAYCNSMNNTIIYNIIVNNNLIVWWNTLRTWLNKTDEILEYLSCSTYPAKTIINYLNIIAKERGDCNNAQKLDCTNLKIQPRDRVNSFLHTVAKNVKNNEFLEYILRNLTEIKPREVSSSVALISITNHLQPQGLGKVREFVKEKSGMKETDLDDITLGQYNNTLVKIYGVPVVVIIRKIHKRFFEIGNQFRYYFHKFQKL